MLLVVAALLAGCAAGAPVPQTPPDRAIGHWLGHPVAEVIDAWGAPSGEAVEAGRRRYFWSATRYGRSYYPANLDPRPLSFGITPQELACRAEMEVDAAGIVTRAEWVGEECRRPR
jgi:hypothetical protein